MAVLGLGGVLDISREIPEALALSPARLNVGGAVTTISLTNRGYWSGDRVIIASSLGVPFDLNGDGYAECPDGHAIYRGSIWDTGISRSFYTGNLTDGSPFYKESVGSFTIGTQSGDDIVTQAGDPIVGNTAAQGDADFWYNNTTNTGLTPQANAYISRDELDRIRFWATEAGAYALKGTEKVISKVKCGNFVIAYYDNTAQYTSAINTSATALNNIKLKQSEEILDKVVAVPSGFYAICDEANRDWEFQCDLQQWALNVDAQSLDITSIGETFGEQIKSLVRGAGRLEFQADNRVTVNEQDSLALLRLVLMTQNQCNTKAKFYLYKGRQESGSQVDGSVYYECDILLTNTSINTRFDEVIAGTADFVATSEIKIRVTPG